MSMIHFAYGLNRDKSCLFCVTTLSCLSRQFYNVKEAPCYFCTVFNVSADSYKEKTCRCQSDFICKAPFMWKPSDVPSLSLLSSGKAKKKIPPTQSTICSHFSNTISHCQWESNDCNIMGTNYFWCNTVFEYFNVLFETDLGVGGGTI